MVSANTHPNPRVFKFLLLTLASAGQVEPIKALERYITDHSLKRRLNYDNLLCTAYITAGRSEEVLDDLLKAVKNTSDKNLEELAQNFPRGGILGILEKEPNHLAQGVYAFEEKLNIIAKVEAGEDLHDVARFYSDNESRVHNSVKCKDAIKSTVQQALPRARDYIVEVAHDPQLPLQAHCPATISFICYPLVLRLEGPLS
ncbi:hypothetical protein E2C01_044164 [Portunus trituberculatus]|uniref:Uncharacterized protein n=1 Tax=Portunus trituberculatus TaxID=210409 RepID=A0A5B7FXM8_PORTR|nr:hypothetical protein [Portunus trituberculatus]